MKNKAVIPILALIALLLVPVIAMGDMDVMDGKATVGSDGAFGYQYTHADGDRPSQFQAYRDVNKGFVFESLHLKGEWNDPAMPYYFMFDGTDLGQDDQVLKAGIGRYGNFRLDFKWTEFPRLYASGVRFVEGYNGNGRYSISPFVQTALDPINGVTPYVNYDPAPASAMRTAVMGLVNSASGTDLRVDRERGRLDYNQKLAPGLNLRVNYVHDFKEGTKLSSTGVYQRTTFNAGALPTTSGEGGERWRVVVIEVPEVVDYDTDMVTAGLDLVRDDWNASLAYSFQQFSNNISTLTFDNPFTDTNRDEKIVGASFRGIGTKTLAQDLAPDSHSHTGTLSGGWGMPFLDARLTGTVSAGGTWQDDPFLPFSTNSAVVTTVPGGTNAADLALLPRQSLDGYVLNVTQNYLLTMRPADPLNVTARYRSYYYDNRTPRIELPGYAELIEERWNTGSIHGPAVASYLRQNGDLDLDYEVSDNVSARADYGWERWRRWERNVDHTDEHKVGGGITVKPLDWMKMAADYHYSNRDGDGYSATSTGGSLEAQGARMFDQSDRSRHAVSARFTVTPMASLDFTASGSYMHDSFNTDILGLDRAYTWEAGADVAYSPTETLTFTANYSHEDSRFKTFGGSKTGAVAGVTTDGASYTDNNLFYSNLIDEVDSFGVGVNGVAIPECLEFGTFYNYTRGVGKINTFNPGARTPLVSINSSQALPFEDTETTAQEVRAELTYRFLKRFALNFKYTFESFRVNDFAWNGMANQIAQVVQDGIIVNDTQRVLLMDAQYSDYDAHVGAVTLSYMF